MCITNECLNGNMLPIYYDEKDKIIFFIKKNSNNIEKYNEEKEKIKILRKSFLNYSIEDVNSNFMKFYDIENMEQLKTKFLSINYDYEKINKLKEIIQNTIPKSKYYAILLNNFYKKNSVENNSIKKEIVIIDENNNQEYSNLNSNLNYSQLENIAIPLLDNFFLLELYLIYFCFEENIGNISIVNQSYNKFIVRMRINALYVDAFLIEKDTFDKISISLKQYSNLDTLEKNKPQSGSCSILYGNEKIFTRISFHPTIFEESISIRILNNKINSLEKIQMNKVNREIIEANILQRKLNIIVGPTGSGKTTMAYALLKFIKNFGFNIISVEDPVEYIVDGVIQSNLKNITYLSGIKSGLRQDIDHIFIGEIRDDISASAVINAVSTGHGVMTTVHASSIEEILTRWQNFGFDKTTFLSHVNLIIFTRILSINFSNEKHLLVEIYDHEKGLLGLSFEEQVEILQKSQK